MRWMLLSLLMLAAITGCAVDQKYSQTELNALQTREFDYPFDATLLSNFYQSFASRWGADEYVYYDSYLAYMSGYAAAYGLIVVQGWGSIGKTKPGHAARRSASARSMEARPALIRTRSTSS